MATWGRQHNVCFGSLADIGERIRNVRFTRNTGRWAVYEHTS